VFKVMAPSRKIFALKRIRLAGRDAEAAAGFVDEIGLLTRLRGQPGIVQLVDAEVVPGEGLILMVLEYGDIDLARLLARQARQGAGAAGGGGAPAPGNPPASPPPPAEPDENFIRLYWQQMLRAVAAIHAARIVHSDLKPANFLVVQGTLKLIDFGIAKAISADTTSIARESQVGTLNYMSPEAILGGAPAGGRAGAKVGRPSDVWSLGCILYQMVHGRTPFAHMPFIQKMHAITDDRHAIAFPRVPGPAGSNAALADVLRRTLDRNPRTRITIPELLAHPFLRPTAEREADGGGPAAAVGGQPTPVVGLTRAQLQTLLARAAAAGAAGGLDVDGLLAETGLGGGGGPGQQQQPAAPGGGGGGAARASPKPPASASTTTASASAGGVAAGLAALRFDDTAGSGAARSGSGGGGA
jgi:serine/threonine-protein kinase TTK/MPS1